MKKHNYSDGVLFSFVLKLSLKLLMPMLSSNSKSLDFELKDFVIIISKTNNIINKASFVLFIYNIDMLRHGK